ncbi:MAG: FxsA family protein [Pseudomonadales bacterium]
MRILFLFFIVVPLVEMLLLFEVSDHIGGLATVGLVVLTAVIGVQILKRQGISTLLRASQRLEAGELPAQEIGEGMLLAAAGALLLTPGFITDTLGFVFLTGPLRRPIARWVISRGIVQAVGRGGGSFSVHGRTASSRANVMEGEYTEVDEQGRPGLERDHSGLDGDNKNI